MLELFNQLERDEGEILHAYQDNTPEKYWTIGFGRLIDIRRGGGITHEEAILLLANDIRKHTDAVLRELPWARNVSKPRLGALINMHFQLGDRLFDFKLTLGHMAAGNWAAASDEMLKSTWAKQTPLRAMRVAEQVRLNKWI